MDREQQIRDRAHQLWVAEGHPEGKHDEHWAQAKQELDGIGVGSSADGSTDVGGLSTALQPGGTIPGASPASGVGSIGTGGGSSGGQPSGTVRR